MSSNQPQQQKSHANGFSTSQKAEGSIQAPAASHPAPGQPASAANGKSVAEYRKKAQGAILNLLPYDVRYQTYIDEGFREDIVGALFDDLKLARISSKAPNGVIPASGPQTFIEHHYGTGSNGQSAAGENDAQHGVSSLTGGTNLLRPTSKGQSISQVPLSSSSNTASVSASTSAPVKSTTMTEKERTLQTKMEALRKSREERAQKAAAKVNPSVIAPMPAPRTEEAKVAGPSEKPTSPSSEPQLTSKLQSSTTQPTPSQQQPPAALPEQKPLESLQQQPPMIPGLFLTSAATSPTPQSAFQAAIPVSTQSNQRKRPVAADFDDPVPAMSTFKRPFGYSPHNDGRPSLVIDLSDDEDEDVAMELDSQADQDSPIDSVRKMSDPRSTVTHNTSPANLPTRTPYTPPNTSATNTPSMPQTTSKASLGRPDDLLRKESEIEQLKKKIAEAEARKKARQTPSGTRTPRASEANGLGAKDANLPDANLGSKVAASIKMQNLIAIAYDKATQEQQKLADVQAAEIDKAAELKRNEAEQKRLRREKLASELPRVDAEVLESQNNLELLRAEMAKAEAAVQKSLEEKRRIADEIERLGQEAEDQLQEVKDRLNTLTQQESRSSNGMFHAPFRTSSTYFCLFLCKHCLAKSRTYPTDPSISASSPPGEQICLPSRSRSVENHENHEEATRAVSETPGNIPKEATPQPPAFNGAADATTNNSGIQTQAENTLPGQVVETKDHFAENEPTDQALEAALQEAVRAEADARSHDSDQIDMETFYAPDPAQLAPELQIEALEEDNRSPGDSPALNRTGPETIDRESDDYEPPDATAPTEALESPPFSPAPPESVQEVADVSMQDIDSTQALDEDEPGVTENTQPLLNGTPQVLLEVNGFYITPIDSGSANNFQDIAKKDSDKIPLFTPYESPLKQFRAYRFHPEFKQDIAGGLRSMTYSHKIDPNAEFCRYELAGGICNDSTCDLQHFRDIKLPGAWVI